MSRRDLFLLFHVSKWTSTVHKEQRERVCVCETYQIGLMSVSWGAGLPETERSVRIHDPKLQHTHTQTQTHKLVYTHTSHTHTHTHTLVIPDGPDAPYFPGNWSVSWWPWSFRGSWSRWSAVSDPIQTCVRCRPELRSDLHTHTHIENVLSENITKWHLNQFIQTKYALETGIWQKNMF